MGDKLNDAYDPFEDSPYMNERHLSYFKDILESWRFKIQLECEELESQLHGFQTGNEYDEADKAFIETEITFTVSKIQGYLTLLNEIDESLEDMKRGKYGFCKKTGEKIGLKRLTAQPNSKFSVKAQVENEHSNRGNVSDSDSSYLFEDAID